MAATVSLSVSLSSKLILLRTLFRFPPLNFIPHLKQPQFNLHTHIKLQHLRPLSPLLRPYQPPKASSSSQSEFEENEVLSLLKERPVKFGLWVLFWVSVSLAWLAASGYANAAADSIRASSFGLKIANALQGLGWADEAVMFALPISAVLGILFNERIPVRLPILPILPVIELRGAIAVGYWLQLKPFMLTVLSVLGNMVPVPSIILYLKIVASFLAGKNKAASQFLDLLFKKAKVKVGPVEEFQWLGLMLFVAVPFTGTEAWTGAIIASILDMPFWSAVSANFFGVVLAGLLVNLLVNLGLKYTIATGIALFFISTFM